MCSDGGKSQPFGVIPTMTHKDPETCELYDELLQLRPT